LAFIRVIRRQKILIPFVSIGVERPLKKTLKKVKKKLASRWRVH